MTLGVNKMLRLRFVVVFALLALLLSSPAHAIDKRLKLVIKTSILGAFAGTIVGAGAYAAGAVPLPKMFIGTSIGMYAGALFAGYIIATPEKNTYHNPRMPRRPLDPEDEPLEDNIKELVPNPPEKGTRVSPGAGANLGVPTELNTIPVAQKEIKVWVALAQFQF